MNLVSLLALLFGVGLIGYVVYTVVSSIRRQRRFEAMMNEFRDLTMQLGDQQELFVKKHSHLTDEERVRIWEPVAEAVNRSVECIIEGLRGNEIRDPRPDMKNALDIAKKINENAQVPPTSA